MCADTDQIMPDKTHAKPPEMRETLDNREVWEYDISIRETHVFQIDR